MYDMENIEGATWGVLGAFWLPNGASVRRHIRRAPPEIGASCATLVLGSRSRVPNQLAQLSCWPMKRRAESHPQRLLLATRSMRSDQSVLGARPAPCRVGVDLWIRPPAAASWPHWLLASAQRPPRVSVPRRLAAPACAAPSSRIAHAAWPRRPTPPPPEGACRGPLRTGGCFCTARAIGRPPPRHCSYARVVEVNVPGHAPATRRPACWCRPSPLPRAGRRRRRPRGSRALGGGGDPGCGRSRRVKAAVSGAVASCGRSVGDDGRYGPACGR